MKRILTLVLAFVLLLTACGRNVSGAGEESSALDSSAAATAPAVSDPITPPVPEIVEQVNPPTPESSVSDETPESTQPIEEQETESMTITITINGESFRATLYDNETAAALKEKLPMTLDMSELNGNEKYNYLPFSLPADAGNPGQIHTGDLMLYGSDCLVLFYESFSTSYRYTPIGRVDDPSGLTDAVGSGSVQVTFALILISNKK